MASATGNKPVLKKKLKGVHIAVFANQTDKGVSHNVEMHRVYKKGEKFESVSNYWRDDIPTAIALLEEAYRFMLEEEEKQRGSGRPQTMNEEAE